MNTIPMVKEMALNDQLILDETKVLIHNYVLFAMGLVNRCCRNEA